MGQTIWTQAATAILATLNASGAPVTFYRARFEATGTAEASGNLFPTKIDCKYEGAANDSVNIDATMVLRCNIESTDNVDLAADPAVLWAWQRIRLDPTLGRLVADVYIDNIELGYVDKSSSDKVSVDITVRVEVAVGRDDPSLNKTYGPAV